MRRIQLFAASAAIAAIGLAATSASAAVNLVKDGDFTQGYQGEILSSGHSVHDWTYSSKGKLNSQAVILKFGEAKSYPNGAFGEAIPAPGTALPKHAKVLYFSTDTGSEKVSQSIDFHKTGEYLVSFEAYAPQNGLNNPEDATLDVDLGKHSIADIDVKTDFKSAGWETFSEVVDITKKGHEDLSFTFAGGGYPAADIAITDVSITSAVGGVPEPASWSLMILGVGGVGAMLRRRRTAVLAA